jgi:DUF971 family protein
MMNSLTPAQKTPTNIEVDLKQSEVRISWADGYHSAYSLDYLRKICPCAACNEQRRNDNPLRVLRPDQIVTKAELRRERPVEMVGNYALQFFWADGHNSGLYTFDFLRQASPQ